MNSQVHVEAMSPTQRASLLYTMGKLQQAKEQGDDDACER